MTGSVNLFNLQGMLIKKKPNPKEELDLGCFRDRLDRHVCNTK